MTVTARTPSYQADIASAAALIADPARAAILRALVPDRPLAAGELGRLACVSAATASFHLAKLLDGGMVTVVRQGRHRYYRLASHEVAAALEALGLISPAVPARTLHQSREAATLAQARTCYDHLAGRAGVELLDAMLRRALLKEQSPGRTDRGASPGPSFDLTGAGALALGSFGLDISEVRRSKRRFAGTCVDWTQRRWHLNGALAAAITTRLFELGWIEHDLIEHDLIEHDLIEHDLIEHDFIEHDFIEHDFIEQRSRRRSVRVTAAGSAGLDGVFGLDFPARS